MIFVTVGSVFPFDRLIRTMDVWAEKTGRGGDCLAQIGKGNYEPSHMEWHRTLPHDRFSASMQQASVVVAHAGMGSVITAMSYACPIVLLPRRFDSGEHTTDHQMATANWLEDKPGVFIAWNETDLPDMIATAEAWTGDGQTLQPYAPSAFTDRIAAELKQWIKK